MELTDRRKRRRAQRRFKTVMEAHMRRVVVIEEEAGDRVRWRPMICCGKS